MGKSVLISIQPKWVAKIANGEKTIEVRKSRPKLDTPFKCYIYETKQPKGRGKVIGEFVCDKIDEYHWFSNLTQINSIGLPVPFQSYLIFEDDYKAMCLSYDEVKQYGQGKTLYGWHISNLVIYDKPKELSEFGTYCKTYPALEDCDICIKNNCPKATKTVNWDCDRVKPLTFPPQSWCYVEEHL